MTTSVGLVNMINWNYIEVFYKPIKNNIYYCETL